MSPVSGIVVYICIWWVVIFCVLPIGVNRSDVGPDEGIAGAPKDAKIKEKFIATTLISALLWVVVYLLIDANIIDFRMLAENMAQEHPK